MEDYEKKYKEALGRANAKIETYNHLGNASVVKSICEIFPELKESEEERIIKALIHYFSEQDGILTAINGSVSVGDILAWLEKQSKKVDAIENFDTEFEKQVSHLIASTINKEYEYTSDFVKWTANTLLNYAKHELEKQDGLSYPYQPGWRKNYSGNKPKVKHSVLMLTTHGIAEGEWLGEEWCQYRWSCKVKDTEVLYWMHLSDLENLEKENEKQGEQKPTDKVEPKFKVGDTIRPKGSMAEYTIESIYGECYHGKGWGLTIGCDEDYELVEQKPTDKVEPKFNVGDTIVEKDVDECDYETIKDIKNGQYIFTDGYCMNIDEQEGWQLVKTTVNKEQKPTWSEEDERNLEGIINEIEANKNNAPDYDLATYDRFLSWLKSLKDRVQPQPKQEWSEEDKGNLLDVKCIIDEVWHNQNVREEIDHSGEELESLWHWLDNIWQKVAYPESPLKQTAWSEEDEKMHTCCEIAIDFFKNLGKNSSGHPHPNYFDLDEKIYPERVIDWLKSLKERYTWKPSNEQMEIIYKYSEQNNYDGSVLTSLYRDLKKLREE